MYGAAGAEMALASDYLAASRAADALRSDAPSSSVTARAAARARTAATRALEASDLKTAALTPSGVWLEPTSSELAAVLESTSAVHRHAGAMSSTSSAERVRFREAVGLPIAPQSPSAPDPAKMDAAEDASRAVRLYDAHASSGGLAGRVDDTSAFASMSTCIGSLAIVSNAAAEQEQREYAASRAGQREKRWLGGAFASEAAVGGGGASGGDSPSGGGGASGGNSQANFDASESAASRRARVFLSSAGARAYSASSPALLSSPDGSSVPGSDVPSFGFDSLGGSSGAAGAATTESAPALPEVDTQAAHTAVGAAPSGFKGSSMVWAALAQANAVASKMAEDAE